MSTQSEPKEKVTEVGSPMVTEVGTTTAVVTPVTDATVTGAEPNPNTLTFSQASFNDRMTRAKTSHVKEIGSEFGIESEKDMRAALKAHQDSQATAETARQASLSKEQQLTEQNSSLAKERDDALAKLEESEFYRSVGMTCAELGISNISYAGHLVFNAASQHEGDSFDERVFLEEQLKDATQLAALGKQVPTQNTPVTTTTTGDPTSAPPAGSNGAGGTVDVMTMSKSEYQAYRSRLLNGQ